MKVHNDHNLPLDNRAITRLSVAAARVVWFFLGPFSLMLILYGIVTMGSGWATGLDAAFFVIVGLMVYCRWIEQRSGQAITVEGKPATWDDFRRYVKVLLPLAVAAWVVANALGNHILTTTVES
jgi:ABC-type polysaccharide/polyol phosphate export permease